MTDPTLNAEIRQLLDKQAISEVLMRYCRGIDRQDREVLSGVFWPGAEDDHILFQGTAEGFVEHAMSFLAGLNTHHFLGNILIDFDSPQSARSEAYFVACHDMPCAVGRQDFTMGGRYLDRLEKRDGEWRIAKRVLTCDWYRAEGATAQWDTGIFRGIRTRGRGGPDDPLYWALTRTGH